MAPSWEAATYVLLSAAITGVLATLLVLQNRAGEFPDATWPWIFVTRQDEPIAFRLHQQIMAICIVVSAALTLLMLLNFLGVAR